MLYKKLCLIILSTLFITINPKKQTSTLNKNHLIAGIVLLSVSTSFIAILIAYCNRRIEERFTLVCQKYEDLFNAHLKDCHANKKRSVSGEVSQESSSAPVSPPTRPAPLNTTLDEGVTVIAS